MPLLTLQPGVKMVVENSVTEAAIFILMSEKFRKQQKFTFTGREICKRKNPFHITLNQRHPFSITEFPIDFRNSVDF